jgi:hypothetical protein
MGFSLQQLKDMGKDQRDIAQRIAAFAHRQYPGRKSFTSCLRPLCQLDCSCLNARGYGTSLSPVTSSSGMDTRGRDTSACDLPAEYKRGDSSEVPKPFLDCDHVPDASHRTQKNHTPKVRKLPSSE